MRITESQLRKIVREEILRETATWDLAGGKWDSPHGLEVTPYHDPDDMEKYRAKVDPKVGDSVQIVFDVNLDPRLKSPRRNPIQDRFNGMMGTIVKVPTSFSDRFYKVEFDDGEVQSFHDIDIKLV